MQRLDRAELSAASNKRRTMSGPTGPKPKEDSKQASVYLPTQMWTELTEAAEFHSEIFKALGKTERVSRNDMIESFLSWALDEYWRDKGGKPSGAKERSEKIETAAERLKSSGSK